MHVQIYVKEFNSQNKIKKKEHKKCRYAENRPVSAHRQKVYFTVIQLNRAIQI